ncbi:MAG: DUF5710 domain-containing protein [Erysipelotrichales bacterium]|nr:DUF5710 domain-containing protein [Erysipelotrichales bacterium]
MPLLLDVPYEDKEEAKERGALWNKDLKKWYAPDKTKYPFFYHWISPNSLIILDYLYIVEGFRECWRCKKQTKVIAFGIENFYLTEGKNMLDHIILCSGFLKMPKSLLEYLDTTYKFRKRFSQTEGHEYYSNGCQYCNALQGDQFLFKFPDSPFVINSAHKAKELTFYKIKLTYDIVSYCDLRIAIKRNLIDDSKIFELEEKFFDELSKIDS